MQLQGNIPIHLNILHYDNSLTNRPSKLKEFLDNYILGTDDKRIFFICKKGIQHTHFYLTTMSSLIKL